MNLGLFILCIAAAFTAAWIWYRSAGKRNAKKRFTDRYRVSNRSTILDADTGRGHGGPDMRPMVADGLVGKPDAIFRNGRRITAGEYKNAQIGSRPRRRDLYQLTLYMGMLQSLHPSAQIDGRLVYNNRTLHIEFDQKLYKRLLGQRQPVLDLLREFEA